MAQDPAPLYWLPPVEDFDAALAGLREAAGAEDATACLMALRALAEHRLDFVQTGRLDRLLGKLADSLPADAPRLRLAIAGSSTLDHLAPGIRVGALRRGLIVELLVCPYG